MKPQIKKTVALILITALSAGVLTLAACKGKNKTETEETTAAEDFLQTEDTDASDNAAQKGELNLSAEEEALLALCEISATIPRGTGTPLTKKESNEILGNTSWDGYHFYAYSGEHIEDKIYLYGGGWSETDTGPLAAFVERVLVLSQTADGEYSFVSLLPDVDAELLACIRMAFSIPKGSGTPLTDAELDDIMEALPCLYRGDYLDYSDQTEIPLCSAFLTDYYTDVKDIDLPNFLHGLQWREEEEAGISEEKLYEVLGEDYEEKLYETIWEDDLKGVDHNNPPRRISVSYLDDLFETYAGISVDLLMDDYKNLPQIPYLEAYDTLYFVQNKWGILGFQIDAGERIGEMICLYDNQCPYEKAILILTETSDGGYQFVSCLPDKHPA